MTRKRYIKMMMGRGVSRNVARKVAEAMRELKKAQGQEMYYIGIGEKEQADLLESVCFDLGARLYVWLERAYWMEQKYREKQNERELTLLDKHMNISLTGA